MKKKLIASMILAITSMCVMTACGKNSTNPPVKDVSTDESYTVSEDVLATDDTTVDVTEQETNDNKTEERDLTKPWIETFDYKSLDEKSDKATITVNDITFPIFVDELANIPGIYTMSEEYLDDENGKSKWEMIPLNINDSNNIGYVVAKDAGEGDKLLADSAFLGVFEEAGKSHIFNGICSLSVDEEDRTSYIYSIDGSALVNLGFPLVISNSDTEAIEGNITKLEELLQQFGKPSRIVCSNDRSNGKESYTLYIIYEYDDYCIDINVKEKKCDKGYYVTDVDRIDIFYKGGNVSDRAIELYNGLYPVEDVFDLNYSK